MLYCVRIISDTCTLHLGEGSGKSSQNPSWNKGRAVIGSSGKAVILLNMALISQRRYTVENKSSYDIRSYVPHGTARTDDDDDVFMITH